MAMSMRSVVRAAYSGRLAGSSDVGCCCNSVSGSNRCRLASPRKTRRPRIRRNARMSQRLKSLAQSPTEIGTFTRIGHGLRSRRGCHEIVVKAATWIRATWIRATGCSTRMQAKLATLARNVRYQKFPRPTSLPWAVSLVCRDHITPAARRSNLFTTALRLQSASHRHHCTGGPRLKRARVAGRPVGRGPLPEPRKIVQKSPHCHPRISLALSR